MLAGLLISDIVNGPGVSTCDEKSVFDFILNIFLGVDISTFVVRHILRVRFYESHFFPIALVWYNSANNDAHYSDSLPLQCDMQRAF